MAHLIEWLGARRFKASAFAPLLEEIFASPRARLFDFVAIDYYDPFISHAFQFPALRGAECKSSSLHSWFMRAAATKWWDWRVLPRGLRFFCTHYSGDYARPVLIAENGMALRLTRDNARGSRRDGMKRSEFLKLHVEEVAQIARQGVPLMGYLHWSLFDNYEWGTYTARFGLFSLDFEKGTDRMPEDFHGDSPSETYARLIREQGAIGEPAPQPTRLA